MAKEIDKIIQSKTAPKSNNVLWDDGENLKINRNGKWESTGGGAPMINITYANLVELRNNNKLIAGMQYRITDYITTTAQANTRSAEHQFDVIVTADNENTLNEVARACKSKFDIEKYKDVFCGTWGEKMLYVGIQEYEGKEYHLYESESQDLQMLVDFNQIKAYRYQQSDPYPCYCYPSFARGYDGSIWEDWQLGLDYGETIQFKYDTPDYFATSKLEAWQIWYSLDNDTERFAWARSPLYSPDTNSKMIMVKDSDNLTYIYVRATGYDKNGKCGWLYVVEGDNKSFIEYVKDGYETVDAEDYIYTNSENLTIGDVLDNGGENVTLIGMSYIEGKGVIYRMIDEWNNDCPYDFKNVQFKRNLNFDEGYAQFSEDGEEVWVYTFAGQSYHINNDEWSGMLDGSLESPNGHMSDEMTHTFHDNTIKSYIKVYNGEEIRIDCGLCYLNNLVLLGYWEKIGSNTDEFAYFYAKCCAFNTFGNDCYNNSFGNSCYNNSLGNGCSSNSFGNSCHNNSFGNSCYNNSLGNDCYNNSFGNSCYNNSFGNSCHSNSFGNSCHSNSFIDQNGIADYAACNRLDDGVSSVELWHDETKGYYGELRNHHICRGVGDMRVEIYAYRDYETTYTMTSDGELREFVLGDIV